MTANARRLKKSTSWVVYLTAALVASDMILEAVMRIFDVQYVDLPHGAFAWVWTAVASGYTGTDRIMQFAKSHTLEYGEADFGNPKKGKRVIWISFILVVMSLALSAMYSIPDLATDALVTAFGGAAASYVIGNKAITAAASSSGDHKATERNRFYSRDK